MQALSDLLALMVFVLVLLLAYLLRSLYHSRNHHQRDLERLQQLLPASANDDPQLSALTRSPRWLQRWPSLQQLQWNLQRLEWPLVGLKNGLIAATGLIVGLMVGKLSQHPLVMTLLVALLTSAALFTVLYLQGMSRYYKELQQALPEAIDAITRTCRAGVPVSNVFALVHKHLNGPLAAEFHLIDQWLQLGVPLKRVMHESTQRIPLPEYRFFVVILIINQEAGGSLTNTLERLTETLRGRIELQLKIQSKTSEARASAKIVAALVPCILGYMYLNSPEDFRFLLDDPVGNGVLAYTTASVLLGLSITFAMVRRVR